MTAWLRPVAVLVALLGVSVALHADAAGGPVASQPVRRVLIVSLPGVSWDDLREHELPNLESFVDRAAIGDLSTRIGRRGASTTDGYLSMGAGTRSLAPDIDAAVALDPDETYGGVRTADILLRRLGQVPSGVAYLPVGAAIDRNDAGPFGGEPGRLGDLLADAAVHRAVVANADAAEGFRSDEPPPDGAYARSAATMLMGSDGIVPGGTVGRSLLEDDPRAPFGRRLDHQAVLAAVDEEWSRPGRSVVVVEASDLSRAAAYGPRATADQRRALRDAALASSDALFGALLERVDRANDAVLIVSPVSGRSSPELAVTALASPSVDGGVLRSATTRRDGYVQLGDIAPTVLALLGLEQPDELEGRRFEVTPRPGQDRVRELAEEADDAAFRDSLMPLVVTLVIVALAVLALLAWQQRRLPEGWRVRVRPAAFVALGVVPATFAAAQMRPVRGSTPAYLAVVGVISLVVGLAIHLADRRWPGSAPVAGVGVVAALFSVDVVAGAPLQVNAVFGYSVAVAGRFAGLGNLAFALFGASAILLAALLVDRLGRRALPAVVVLLIGVVLLEGLPMLGADVGGVLSMVPAFGLTALVLSGRRPKLATVGWLIAGSLTTVLLFAFVDVARPAGERTHLARLAEHLVDGRWGSLSDTLTRRLQASFGSAEVAAWLLVLGAIVGVGAYLVLLARRPSAGGTLVDRAWLEHEPTLAAVVGLAVLAALGLVANDSSIAVPATMLIVITPVAVLERCRPEAAAGGT